MVTERADNADSSGRIFVSHSSRDAESAMQIVAALESAGVPCWVAPRDITAGADWNHSIMTGINDCRALLLLCSRHSVDSDPVKREVERAINRRVPIIPIRLEQVPPSPALEFMISTYQWVDAYPPPVDRHLENISGAVKQALALPYTPPIADRNAPPKYVRSYRILEALGEGGMGTVYKAEQRAPVKRIVAIKLIKLGFDSAEVIARFESERQALARMDHPNVAKVLDGGTDEVGRPFFVMEYVPGVPVTQFADENNLTIRQRLELFLQICDAIAHAHTKALIHRDIKPSNVLAYVADGKPQVKVIDFGIAKALTGDRLSDRTFNTERGQAIGTYESMSPEQAEGSPDIDTRTDVYSLGVLLYELLAGAKPFDKVDMARAADAEVRRMIRETEPPKPSTRLSSLGDAGTKVAAARQAPLDALTRQLRSELEWIPLMAMRKERGRRYASALELSADISNYLAGQPLMAGPESRAYRMKKFVGRHRAGLAAAAAVVLGVSGGTGAYVHGIRVEKQRTEAALVQTRAQKARADENGLLAAKRFDEKRAALDKMLESFSDERLKNMPGSHELRRAFLERGLSQYGQMLHDRRDDPVVKARLADTYRELGILEKEVGAADEALQALRSAVDLRRQFASSAPGDDRAAADLGHALFQLGQSFFEQKKAAEALVPVQESVEVFTRLLAHEPDNASYKDALGRSLTRLVTVNPAVDSGKTLQQARDLLQQAAAALPANSDVLTDLARALANTGAYLLAEHSNSPEALALYQEAVARADDALRLNPLNSTASSIRAKAIQNEAATLDATGHGDEAIRILRDSADRTAAFFRKNPAVLSVYDANIDTLSKLIDAYWKSKEFDQVVATCEEVIRVVEELARRAPRDPSRPRQFLDATGIIADAQNQRSRKPEAAASLDRAVARADEMMRQYPRNAVLLGRLLDLMYRRGQLESEAKRHRDALPSYLGALSLFEKNGDPRDPNMDGALSSYLQSASAAADCNKALDDLSTAISVVERALGTAPADPRAGSRHQIIALMMKRAHYYQDLPQVDKALAAWIRVRDQAAGAADGPPVDVYLRCALGTSQGKLAALYRMKGNLGQEVLSAHEALRTMQSIDGKDYSALIRETADPTEANAAKLRDALGSAPRVSEFEIKVVVDGSQQTLPFCVTDSFQLIEDQRTWVREALKGDVITDAWNTFIRLRDIAAENKVSFQNLCEYAINKKSEDAGDDAGAIAVMKQDAANTSSDPATHRKLTEARLRMATRYFENSADYAAAAAVEDALAGITLEASGNPRDPKDWALLAEAHLIQGHLESKAGNDARAYNALLESIRCYRVARGPDLATDGAREYEIGSVCDSLGRPTEAAYWYLTAGELGRHAAIVDLGKLYMKSPRVAAVFPAAFLAALDRAARESSAAKPAPPPTTASGTTAPPTGDSPILFAQTWEKYRRQYLIAGATLPVSNRISLLIKLDAPEMALDLLQKALKAPANDPREWAALAPSAERLHQWAGAADAYRHLLDLDPNPQDHTAVPSYLRSLLLCGRARDVGGEAQRLQGLGWDPLSRDPEGEAPYEPDAWGICAIAAVVVGKDVPPRWGKNPATVLARPAKSGLSWEPVRDWIEKQKLPPGQQKKVAEITASLGLNDKVDKNGKPVDADLKRTILLLNGTLDTRKPFWVFVAVRPTKYRDFQAAYNSGKLDLKNFKEFGEVIVSGDGDKPPREVVKKVAEMYQTDPATLMGAMEEEAPPDPAK